MGVPTDALARAIGRADDIMRARVEAWADEMQEQDPVGTSAPSTPAHKVARLTEEQNRQLDEHTQRVFLERIQG